MTDNTPEKPVFFTRDCITFTIWSQWNSRLACTKKIYKIGQFLEDIKEVDIFFDKNKNALSDGIHNIYFEEDDTIESIFERDYFKGNTLFIVSKDFECDKKKISKQCRNCYNNK